MPLRVAVLFSGGKDSTFAVWHCLQKKMDVKYLVTMEPKSRESYMFHYPNIGWTKLQSEAMGIKQHMHYTSGEKETELNDLIAALRPIRHEIDAVAAGGLASTYQADRIGKVAHGLGLKPVVPFWHTEIENYWRMIITAGFEVIMTGVAADGLGREWLGRRIGPKEIELLKKLSDKHRFHLGGEGGEYETMVLDGPIFKKKLVPLEAEVAWDDSTSSGFYIIKDMMAIDKKELANLVKEYSHKKDAVRKRLEEFKQVGSNSSQERLFAELAFCLCTPQSKAKTCWAAVELLRKENLLLEGGRTEIEKNLKGVRFHVNKAKYIEEARNLLTKGGKLDVRLLLSKGGGFDAKNTVTGKDRMPDSDRGGTALANSQNSQEPKEAGGFFSKGGDISAGGTALGMEPKHVREVLVAKIRGLGYKEASHFLRNIGMGQGIAILDRHILKNLQRLGVIDAVPASLSPKKYMEIERRMSAFCAHAGIPEDELDLLLWSKETGEIFK